MSERRRTNLAGHREVRSDADSRTVVGTTAGMVVAHARGVEEGGGRGVKPLRPTRITWHDTGACTQVFLLVLGCGGAALRSAGSVEREQGTG